MRPLVECGLVIANEGKRYDRFRDRVMFPIFSARGAVIGFGGRVLGDGRAEVPQLARDRRCSRRAANSTAYAQAREAIRAARRALVVEGYMDVVALAQFEVGYAVATLGTATTPVHVAKLLRAGRRDRVLLRRRRRRSQGRLARARGKPAAGHGCQADEVPLPARGRGPRHLRAPPRQGGLRAPGARSADADGVPAGRAARAVGPRDGRRPLEVPDGGDAPRAAAGRAGAAPAGDPRDRAPGRGGSAGRRALVFARQRPQLSPCGGCQGRPRRGRPPRRNRTCFAACW